MNNDVQVKNHTIEKLVSFSNNLNGGVNVVSSDSSGQDTIIKSRAKILSWVLNRTKYIYHGVSLQSILSNCSIEIYIYFLKK